MNRTMVALTASLVAVHADRTPPPVMHLVAPEIGFPARLMGFALSVRSGQVVSLDPCPPGWKITVDNDPSWNGRVTGQAYVGAASLPFDAVEHIVALRQIPHTDVYGRTTPRIAVSGSITVLQGDRLDTLSFPALRLSPAP